MALGKSFRNGVAVLSTGVALAAPFGVSAKTSHPDSGFVHDPKVFHTSDGTIGSHTPSYVDGFCPHVEKADPKKTCDDVIKSYRQYWEQLALEFPEEIYPLNETQNLQEYIAKCVMVSIDSDSRAYGEAPLFFPNVESYTQSFNDCTKEDHFKLSFDEYKGVEEVLELEKIMKQVNALHQDSSESELASSE